MTKDEFAVRVDAIRVKLFRTALIYMGNETQAADVLDEAVYKALCKHKSLRQEQYFDTWITRIVIHECYNELRRQKRVLLMDSLPENAAETFDTLPLKEAIRCLPKELKDVVILRFFSGYNLSETADILQIPVGTVSTRQRKALQLLRLELEEEVPG